MAYDALSSTTRKTRIRLLNSCAAYIVVQTFQIDVEANGLFKIPEGSPDGILSMLTLGLMCFLFISFLIYGYDDWRSIEPKGSLRHANSIKENLLLEIRRAMGKTQGRDVKHVWRDKYKLNQDANKIHEELLAQSEAGVEKVDNLLERNQIFDLLLVENRKDIYEAYKDYIHKSRNNGQSNWQGRLDVFNVDLRIFWEFIFPVIAFTISVFAPLYSNLLLSIID